MFQANFYVWDLMPYHPDWVLGDSSVNQSIRPAFYPDPIKSPREATEWFVQTKPLSKIEILERPAENMLTQWFVLGFIFFLFLIVLSKQFNPRKFLLLFRAGFSASGLNLLLREWNPSKHVFALVFTLIYIASVSLLAISLLPGFTEGKADFDETSPEFLSKVVILIGAIVFFKVFMAWFLSYLFDTVETTAMYLANMLSHILVFSVTAMILSILLLFVPMEILWYLSLLIIVILLIISLIRSVMIGLLEYRYSGLLLFLYLCALEIAPVLVLIKSIGLISANSFSG
jgi:hypothetical protein